MACACNEERKRKQTAGLVGSMWLGNQKWGPSRQLLVQNMSLSCTDWPWSLLCWTPCRQPVRKRGKSRDKEKYEIVAMVIEGGSNMVAAVCGYLHCIIRIPMTRKNKGYVPIGH